MYISSELLSPINAVSVYLEGNLTAATHRAFEKRFEAALTLAPVVLLDMHEVKLLDSTGLGALIRCLRLSVNKQSRLLLIGLQPSPRMVLELTRTEQLFDIYPTQAAALARLETEEKIA